jgi:hypothetical protein
MRRLGGSHAPNYFFDSYLVKDIKQTQENTDTEDQELASEDERYMKTVESLVSRKPSAMPSTRRSIRIRDIGPSCNTPSTKCSVPSTLSSQTDHRYVVEKSLVGHP